MLAAVQRAGCRRLLLRPAHVNHVGCYRGVSTRGGNVPQVGLLGEHPILLAGMAGVVIVGGFVAYLYTRPRYGLASSTLYNVGGRELACEIKGTAANGRPTVLLDMGTAAAAAPLAEKVSKFARVISVDRQGQGGSDVHPKALDQAVHKELALAHGILLDKDHPGHTDSRVKALAVARAEIKRLGTGGTADGGGAAAGAGAGSAAADFDPAAFAAAMARRRAQAGRRATVSGRGTPASPASDGATGAAGAAREAPDKPLTEEGEHAVGVLRAVELYEPSQFAPPQTGIPATLSAHDLALLLNATDTPPNVVVVTYKGNWTTAAELAAKNGGAVRGVVIVDALQSPANLGSRDPRSLAPADVTRVTQMLEDGLWFTWCGHGRPAVPPMARYASSAPIAYDSRTEFRKVFRHVMLQAEVDPKWKWFDHVVVGLALNRAVSVSALSDDAIAAMTDSARPVSLCITDRFFTKTGLRRLQSITAPLGAALPPIDYKLFESQKREEVEAWRRAVPHLRVCDGLVDPEFTAGRGKEADDKRWAFVAQEIERMVSQVEAQPQADARQQ